MVQWIIVHGEKASKPSPTLVMGRLSRAYKKVDDRPVLGEEVLEQITNPKAERWRFFPQFALAQRDVDYFRMILAAGGFLRVDPALLTYFKKNHQEDWDKVAMAAGWPDVGEGLGAGRIPFASTDTQRERFFGITLSPYDNEPDLSTVTVGFLRNGVGGTQEPLLKNTRGYLRLSDQSAWTFWRENSNWKRR